MADNRTLGERVSDIIAKFGGSWKFIFISGFIFMVWILINTIFHEITFDPAPFILLNLVLSFIAAFQAPFIMMSQNRAEKKQDDAYRILFHEIKELVEQDIDFEKKINNSQSKLLDALQQAIALENLNRQDLAEILNKCCEEEI